MDTLNFFLSFSLDTYLDSINAYCSTTCLAYPINSSPSGVTDIPRLVLLKSSTPISSSSSLMAEDRLGWEIYSFLAASFIEEEFATVIAYRNWVNVIIPPSFSLLKHKLYKKHINHSSCSYAQQHIFLPFMQNNDHRNGNQFRYPVR